MTQLGAVQLIELGHGYVFDGSFIAATDNRKRPVFLRHANGPPTGATEGDCCQRITTFMSDKLVESTSETITGGVTSPADWAWEDTSRGWAALAVSRPQVEVASVVDRTEKFAAPFRKAEKATGGRGGILRKDSEKKKGPFIESCTPRTGALVAHLKRMG